MVDLVEAFINENIWEINQFPRCGYIYNYFTLNDIFFYNSLNDRTFEKENKTATVQIPESLIESLDINITYSKLHNGKITVREFVLANKDIIIKNKYPIIKKEIKNNRETWSCDLNMMFFDDSRNWKNDLSL